MPKRFLKSYQRVRLPLLHTLSICMERINLASTSCGVDLSQKWNSKFYLPWLLHCADINERDWLSPLPFFLPLFVCIISILLIASVIEASTYLHLPDTITALQHVHALVAPSVYGPLFIWNVLLVCISWGFNTPFLFYLCCHDYGTSTCLYIGSILKYIDCVSVNLMIWI